MEESETTECQVCGERAIGFYCGANVCEACKKFFVRCLKLDLMASLKCSFDGQCVIDRANRTKCPYCRMKRCFLLKMEAPGGKHAVDRLLSLPCQVCQAPSSGFHFGAYTCEGCKGFFRKCLLDKNFLITRCQREQIEGRPCEVTQESRNDCKFCRFEKCLRVGMDLQKVRIGRQSNLIKHKVGQLLENLKSKTYDRPRIDSEFSTKMADILNSEKKKKKKFGPSSRSLAPHKRKVKVASSSCSTTSRDVVPFGTAGVTGEVEVVEVEEEEEEEGEEEGQPVLQAAPDHKEEDIHHLPEGFPSRGKVVWFKNRQPERSSATEFHGSPPYFHGESQVPLNALVQSHRAKRFQNVDLRLDIVGTKQRDFIHHVTESFGILEFMFDLRGENSLAMSFEPSREETWDLFVSIIVQKFPPLVQFTSRISEVEGHLSREDLSETSGGRNIRQESGQISPRIIFGILGFLSARKFGSNKNSINFLGMDQSLVKILLEKFESMRKTLCYFSRIDATIVSLRLDRTEVSLLCSIFIMDLKNMWRQKCILIDTLEYYETMNYGDNERFVRVISSLRLFYQYVELRKLAVSLMVDEARNDSFSTPIPAICSRYLSESAWSIQ